MWKYLVSNSPNLSKSGYEFKMIYSYEKRKEETKRLKAKYPNKIPTIIEKSNTAMLQKMVNLHSSRTSTRCSSLWNSFVSWCSVWSGWIKMLKAMSCCC